MEMQRRLVAKQTEIGTVVQDLKTSMKAQFFLSTNGEACVSLVDEEKFKSFFIESGQWRDWLIRYSRKKGWQINSLRREQVLEELVALASECEEKRPVYVRVASVNDKIYVDLNTAEYKYAEIDKKGFRLVSKTPVPFIRPAKQRPLPEPIAKTPQHFLSMFSSTFSLKKEDCILVLAFLLKAIQRDRGSYAFLILEGAQGSGKTTLSNWLKSLIDPSEPLTYSPPGVADDIIIASTHSFLLVFDNISGINGTMADYFCRLSSGGGIAKRKLYADDAEKVYALHRPVIINGIDEPTNRSDFMDRCITIELKPIDDKNRIAETQLYRQFQENLPALLGGLYSTLSACMNELPNIQNSDLPRMTDFARMGIALEKVLGLAKGEFLRLYQKRRVEQSDTAFWTDEVCSAIYDKLQRGVRPLEGTTSQIKDILFSSRMGSAPKTQMSLKAFSGRLKRIEPVLLSKGIVIERLPRTSEARNILIRWIDPKKNIKESENRYL